MQEFDTKAIRHQFKINGRTYWLAGITLEDFEEASRIQSLQPPEARIPVWRDFLASRVRPRFGVLTGRFGARAARSMNILQLMDLWWGWVGLPGEAQSSSLLSSESTAPSSSPISDSSTTAPSGMSEGTNSES